MGGSPGKRRVAPAFIVALVLGVAAAAGISGCDLPWEDDETTVTIQTTTSTTTETQTTRQTETGSPNQGPDRAGNDIPPPPGSPAARFERFCRQNPGACD
jgi:hypothetical protein